MTDVAALPGSLMQSTRRNIPSFSLYGEAPAAPAQTDGVHIEDIPSRSRKYLWKIGTHRHTLLSQCVVVTAGPVTVALDDVRAALAGPAVMIIPAGTVHSFRFRADTQGHVLTVDLARVLSMASDVHRLPIETLFSEPRAIDLAADPQLALRVGQLLERLQQEFRQPDSWGAPLGSWLALCVFWILAFGTAAHGTAELHAGHDAERLRRFRHLIESHYLKHWPVERYARQLALSETSLNRLCRRLAGGTAFDLIQQRLALEARRRLVYAANSVSGIAGELGFKDPAYFSRFFRRHSGVSPNEFRRRHHGV
jgi:AraC family transcriptional regulator, transcriptional activator of pobA